MLRAATAQDGLSNYPSGSLLGPWELTTVLVMALTLTLVAVLAGNDSFYMHIATTVVITAGFALSLGVITRVGYWSLGHASFMGLGAYASVLAVTKLAMPIVVGLVCAMLIGGLTAAPIGAVLMRLRGAYFIMVTFALGELVRLTFVSESSIFGGSGGITKIPPLVFTGLGGRFSSPLFSAYLLASALLVSEMVILLTIVRSSIGRIWDSIRENPDLAESQGIPIHRYKVYAFVIGGAMAGRRVHAAAEPRADGRRAAREQAARDHGARLLRVLPLHEARARVQLPVRLPESELHLRPEISGRQGLTGTRGRDGRRHDHSARRGLR